MPYPLLFVPKHYHAPPLNGGVHRFFGAPRGERLHAGCDLFAERGTEIFAVEDGVVVERSENFYHNGVKAIALQHTGGYVVRYCEVLGTSIDGIQLGQTFRAGQVVARVGKMFKDSMLHFEMYSGSMHGHLSQKKSASAFQRRADLIDPTSFLDRLSKYVGVCHPTPYRVAPFSL